jgi:hypothetical protein
MSAHEEGPRDGVAPNIKTRLGGFQDLIEFVARYEMPLPCTVEIWHGWPRDVWFVTPEAAERSKRTWCAPCERPTTGVTEPTSPGTQAIERHNRTQGADDVTRPEAGGARVRD